MSSRRAIGLTSGSRLLTPVELTCARNGEVASALDRVAQAVAELRSLVG